MSNIPVENPSEPVVEPSAAASTPPEAETSTRESAEAPEAPKSSPWEDPEAARAEIERLRRENGAARTNAKAQAAEEARRELAQTIGKALGIVEDDKPVDPAQLTEQLTASQAEAKQARVELAVFRNAATAGGDPAALLDSSSFLRSLDSVDPTDGSAVAEAIRVAVEANPRLGAAPAEPKAPAPNPAQGSSASGPGTADQLTEADVKRLYAQGRFEEISKARAEGRLDSYLGS